VELLVAASIASVVLAASWAWLWNVGGASSATADHARAATAAAFAVRSITDDLDASASLQAPPSGYSPARTLSLLHIHSGAAAEAVLIVWDPSRRVLWRKAPGTYLADQVSRFDVTYLDAAGRELSPADLAGTAWPGLVATVAVTAVVSAGHESAAASCSVALGQR
jgi:hypothetical protein